MPIEVDGLLVKVRAGSAFAASNTGMFGKAEVILEVPPGKTGSMGLAADEPTSWLKVDAGDSPWDRAHSLMAQGFAANGGNVVAAEPDIVQRFTVDRAIRDGKCVSQLPVEKGGLQAGPHFGWHLDNAFSGLRSARNSVPAADQRRVLIAHLDTGYDPAHAARPVNILTGQERNFTSEGAPDSARDVTPAGLLNNPGHGPATIVLLAGGDPGGLPDGFTGPIGGIPDARILPIRIADSVVRLSSGTMVQGFAYALKNKADVLSMSMGGLASAAVADAVNLCYMQGMVMVTAAGNFLGNVPSPRSIVYPARMRRIIAATGVMANGAAYFGLGSGVMQGCHGPEAKMDTALAAWTPNTPWAELGCLTNVDQDGAGTSSATPQIAAAAALWIARNFAALAQLEPWQKGEAVRQALFGSARKTTALLNADQVRDALGQGALDAVRALSMQPAAAQSLRMAPEASAALAWLKLLTGSGVGVTVAAAAPRAAMLGLEVLQLTQLSPALEDIVPDPEAGTSDPAVRKQFLEALRDSRLGSKVLNRHVERALAGGDFALPVMKRAGGPARPSGTASRNGVETPANRRLRIFALDPSLGGSLASFASAIATVEVPYEADAEGNSILTPGPVGEYLEVVDVDPASNQFYPPVDLDDPRLLLTDGLEPSEGNPRFHQQMVYAVGMRTILNFESALGRRALWATNVGTPAAEDGKVSFEYVQRLRIYPHALRAQNAYYSPDRIALLFGYFPADSKRSDSTAPGTLVFSCLSADIVAHEMTHALLDGYTPGYRDLSNPDVGAFHEAFADIVALFQHFQYGDLVRSEIGKARGRVDGARLLGGLAKQFGEGIGKEGALRDYLRQNDDASYETAFEAHDRGALLVLGVYRAFEAIFELRAGDLVRLATGGSGTLAPGEIHPDLAARLAAEAGKVAGQILRMCIRALDYCPPVDITFGNYMRALITADIETIPEDLHGYRVAFLEKFRALGLLPTNLRTVSIETLRWQRPRGNRCPTWLLPAMELLDIDWRVTADRATIFQRSQRRCADLHEFLLGRIGQESSGDRGNDTSICQTLGLQPDLDRFDGAGKVAAQSGPTCFEVRNVRRVRRILTDGHPVEEIIVTLLQRKPARFDPDDPRSGFFWFRGGSTVVINPRNHEGKPEIKYVVRRSIEDLDRLAEERAFRTDGRGAGARSMYFGPHSMAMREPFAVLHAREY